MLSPPACDESGSTHLLAQSHPALGEHDGISRILWIETHRGGESETAGMKVDELTEVSYLLGSFVGHPGHVVVVDQKSRRTLRRAWHFLNIDHRAVGDSTDTVEPFPAFPLQLVGGLRLATQQEVGDG